MTKKAKKVLDQLEEVPEVVVPLLSVIVDFNQLYHDHDNDAFEVIGKLKDLLT